MAPGQAWLLGPLPGETARAAVTVPHPGCQAPGGRGAGGSLLRASTLAAGFQEGGVT